VEALITDFSMPGMNGLDLIREMRKRRPTLPAILLTGHVGDIAEAELSHPTADKIVVLQKPVRPAELAGRLAALVNSPTWQRG
jgi:CheY-like chemotaxis protein